MGSGNVLGAIRQQAITLTNVDPNLPHHMASLSHSELKKWYWFVCVWMCMYMCTIETYLTLLALKPEYSRITTGSSVLRLLIVLALPCIARTSAATVLTLRNKWTLIYLQDTFQLPASAQYSEIKEDSYGCISAKVISTAWVSETIYRK